MDKKMTTKGSCVISGEVIATIATVAAREVPGVTGLASRPTDLKGILYTGAERSVAVTSRESTISLDVYVNIEQDGKIQEIATEVQQNVKAAVQAMTGKPVTRVNVHVVGIGSNKKEKAAQ